jgi:hypothetical protein
MTTIDRIEMIRIAVEKCNREKLEGTAVILSNEITVDSLYYND